FSPSSRQQLLKHVDSPAKGTFDEEFVNVARADGQNASAIPAAHVTGVRTSSDFTLALGSLRLGLADLIWLGLSVGFFPSFTSIFLVSSIFSFPYWCLLLSRMVRRKPSIASSNLYSVPETYS